MLCSWFHTSLQPFLFCFFFFFSPPRVTQLKRLQRLVLRSVPSWDHAPSTVLGLLAARADNSCLVGGRASLSGWQHLSEPGASCQHLARNSWTQKKMTASRCINVASLPLRNTLGSAAVEAQYSVCVGVCVCVLVCLVLVSCSPSLSLSISRMISLTRAPRGSVILVISSTRRSIVAASGRPNNAEKRQGKKKLLQPWSTAALLSPAHDKIRPESWP